MLNLAFSMVFFFSKEFGETNLEKTRGYICNNIIMCPFTSGKYYDASVIDVIFSG